MTEKVKILYNIPSLTHGDKTLRKAFETFFWLKHYNDNGIITDYSRQTKDLADQCHISMRTLWSRIQLMKKYRLIRIVRVDKNNVIELQSWKTIRKIYEIKHEKFYYISTDEDTNLEHVLIAKAHQEGQKRQVAAFNRRVKENNLRNELHSVTGGEGFNRQAVIKSCITAFKFPSLFTETEIAYLNRLRADSQYNCRKIALSMGCKSASSGTYIKQVLQREGLIRVTKRKYESEERFRFSTLGKVFYNRRNKKTFLIMPDLIDVL